MVVAFKVVYSQRTFPIGNDVVADPADIRTESRDLEYFTSVEQAKAFGEAELSRVLAQRQAQQIDSHEAEMDLYDDMSNEEDDDQGEESQSKVITICIQAEGDALAVSFFTLAGEPFAAQRRFGLHDDVGELRDCIRNLLRSQAPAAVVAVKFYSDVGNKLRSADRIGNFSQLTAKAVVASTDELPKVCRNTSWCDKYGQPSTDCGMDKYGQVWTSMVSTASETEVHEEIFGHGWGGHKTELSVRIDTVHVEDELADVDQELARLGSKRSKLYQLLDTQRLGHAHCVQAIAAPSKRRAAATTKRPAAAASAVSAKRPRRPRGR